MPRACRARVIRPMQAPAFWWHSAAAPAARLLSPLAWLYGRAAAVRLARRGTHLPVPVICVGNFVVGGAGKTPTALALGRRFIAMGERPFFLSRGYRSRAERRGPLRVDLAHHKAADVGDEPLLLARVAPTIVGADRTASGRLAVASGASVLILDDGLQNPALEKDLRLVVVDGETGIGNNHCLPAGPLRAPLAPQMALASAVVIVGDGSAGAAVARLASAANRPVLTANLVIPATAGSLAGQKVYAFAGIARPQKFRATLAAAGADVAGMRNFPDHHRYNLREIADLQAAAKACAARLVTTEKDFVRLTDLGGGGDEASPLAVPVVLTFADEAQLDHIIASAMAAANERLMAAAPRA